MATRSTTWRDLVLHADPDHARKSRHVIEYEFTSPGRKGFDGKTHEEGQRVFRGNTDERGPYDDE